MKLSELISVLPFARNETNLPEIEIIHIETDSRKVKPKSLFVCIEGFNTDGHLYIKEAINKGAVAIIAEKEVESDRPVIYVNDSTRALAMLVNKFYEYPTSKLSLIGITGTNGKTTISYLLDAIFQNYGKKTGVIGTIQNKVGSNLMETNNTTPDALVLQRLFVEMKTQGVEQAIMEVSSHALDLGRVYGCDFDTVIFTNLTQDHLDYHKNELQYFHAKSLLFSQLGNSYYETKKYAVINADDPYSESLQKMTSQPIVTYGIEKKADVRASNVELFPNRTSFRLKTPLGTVKITSRLIGEFNVYNMLAACSAAIAHQVPIPVIKETLETIMPIPGRFETVDCGQQFGVIVDYAHTPHAVQNILQTCKELTRGKLYCVLGCGGDRDKAKRPRMAKEAVTYANYAIFTSDNPRTEDPQEIIKDMIRELPEHVVNYEIILDRKAAIEKVIEYAEEGDMVVIAGKGHETYQEINGKRYPFDDRLVARNAIENKEI